MFQSSATPASHEHDSSATGGAATFETAWSTDNGDYTVQVDTSTGQLMLGASINGTLSYDFSHVPQGTYDLVVSWTESGKAFSIKSQIRVSDSQ